MFQEQDILTLSQDDINLQEKSKYPYLSLLEKICISIKEELRTTESYSKNFSAIFSEASQPNNSFDKNLYPYSFHLVTLIAEANIKTSRYSEEKLNLCDTLEPIMKNLFYPLEKISDNDDSQKDLLYLTDMTFATKLKKIVHQSITENSSSVNSRDDLYDQTYSEFSFLLENVYPTESVESKDQIYSEMLKKICFDFKTKNNSGKHNILSSISGHQEKLKNNKKRKVESHNLNLDSQLHFHIDKNSDNNSYKNKVAHKQCSVMKESECMHLNSSTDNFSNINCELDKNEDLFQAIMENVEAYSRHNSDQTIVSKDKAISYQSKWKYKYNNKNKLKENEIKNKKR